MIDNKSGIHKDDESVWKVYHDFSKNLSYMSKTLFISVL